jgi:hypothetical protein
MKSLDREPSFKCRDTVVLKIDIYCMAQIVVEEVAVGSLKLQRAKIDVTVRFSQFFCSENRQLPLSLDRVASVPKSTQTCRPPPL